MPTQKNWEGTSPPKKAAQPAKTTTNRSEGNWVGGGTSKSKANYATKAQMNFEGSIDIPSKFEGGQGQKPGTGSQGGY